MWRSFGVTTAVSGVTAVLLYLLSLFLNKEKGSEETPLCRAMEAEPPAPPEAGRRSEWIAWALQKVLAPVILVGVLSMVRKLVIKKELDIMDYENNAAANFWINSLSKAVFFAVKECPKLLRRELWARILVGSLESGVLRTRRARCISGNETLGYLFVYCLHMWYV